MIKETSKIVLLGLFCCGLPIQGLRAEAETAPGDRWLKKAQQQELEPFEVEAYQQLSRIHGCEFQQGEHRGSIQILSFSKESEEPMDMLYAMGLKVLPILSEALDDSTPSQTVTTTRGSQKRVNLFNAYHGMALLGRKQQALTELERLLQEYGNEMEGHARVEYEALLKKAKRWEENTSSEDVTADAVNCVASNGKLTSSGPDYGSPMAPIRCLQRLHRAATSG